MIVRKSLRPIVGPLLLAGVALGAACSPPLVDTRSYVDRIAGGRAAKDEAFKNARDGDPVPMNLRAEFLPLAYFSIEQDYKTPAILKPSNDPTIINMPTSTGTNRQMRRAGALEFTLKDQPLKLTAFHEVGSDPSHLFVPFSDLTSGTETYAAGRYLDLDRNATGIYEIDFNLAYNPYCYYNPTYECPYPPMENRLKVPVRAGERLKQANK